MKPALLILVLACATLANAQEFEVASIKAVPPRAGHNPPDPGSGGPGTSSPSLFRCANCTLATLISRAWDLQPYEFPGRGALSTNNFEVMARIPEGATPDQFRVMLQNLLKQRFGLAVHLDIRTLRGYQLVQGPKGAPLKAVDSDASAHGAWGGHGNDSHNGLVVFGEFARFQVEQQPVAALARAIADQVNAPVEDKTGLTGLYDFSLRWNNGNGGSAAQHSDAFRSMHEGLTPGGSGFSESTPSLSEALHSLGLKLAATERVSVRVLVVEHVEPTPTAN
jgi:uncharacterized protein (TIGR03435 family)